MAIFRNLFSSDGPRNNKIPNTLILLAAVGVSAILLYGLADTKQFILKVAQCLLLALASIAIGIFVGFLFGIPKQTSKYIEGRYTSNTNLEEISDWLTKILVGLGLAELTYIPGKFETLTERISLSMKIVPQDFVGCIIVYFLIIGFFAGYLITRIYLSKEFADAEKRLEDLSQTVEKLAEVKEKRLVVDSQLNMAEDLQNTEDLVNKNIDKPVSDIIKQTQQLEQAGISIPSAQYFKQGRIMVMNQNYHTAKEYFQKSYAIGKHYKAGNNLAVILSRFLLKLTEAEKILKELIAAEPNNPLAYYNLACNYVRMQDQENAMKNLKKALELDNESYLSQAKKDSTFEPLKDRQDFKELVRDYNPGA